jgi:hypothetical protein
MAGVNLSVLVDADISRYSQALNNASIRADDFKKTIGDSGEKIRLGAKELKILGDQAYQKKPLPIDDSFKKFGQTVKENARVASESVAGFTMRTEEARRSVSSLIKVFPQLAALRMAFHPVTLALAGLAFILSKVKKGYKELVEAQKPVISTPLKESIEAQNAAAEKYVKSLQDVGGAYSYVKRMQDEYMKGLKNEADFEIKLSEAKKEAAIEQVRLSKAKGDISGIQAAEKIAEIEGRTAQEIADIKSKAADDERKVIEQNLEALGKADEAEALRLKTAREQVARYNEAAAIAAEIAKKNDEIIKARQLAELQPKAEFDGVPVLYGGSVPGIKLMETELADLEARLLSVKRAGKDISPPVFEEQQKQAEEARMARAEKRITLESKLQSIGTEQAQSFALEFERRKADDAKKQIEILQESNRVLKQIDANTKKSGKTLTL